MATQKEARRYVGGSWDYTGKKQFEFMLEEGLKPEHKFLDVGCGCFRGGRFFIEYLNKGNYYGIEKHMWLVEHGMRHEIKNLRHKNYNIIVRDDFNVSPFKTKFDFGLAKSVFTHLTKKKIKECLIQMYDVMDGPFYASIFVGDSTKNLKDDNDNKRFFYSIDEIKELAEGWNVKSLSHRGCHHQTMLKFTIKK